MSSIAFTTDSLFENVIYNSEADSWFFVFTDKISVSVSGFWRLLEKNRIFLVSLDHDQQFGLPEPVDLEELIRDRLSGEKAIKIEIDKNTGDLSLLLTDELELKVYIASTGYETYDLSVGDKRYIGLGSGNIAIMDI